MTLPPTLSDKLEDETGLRILGTESVSGGSINRTARIETDQGFFFLKWNRQAPADMFEREADGLNRLARANTGLVIPAIHSWSPPEDEIPGYLLMDYIHPDGGSNRAFRKLGEGLAQLHEETAPQFGLDVDNYIGRLPQSNRRDENWARFFIRERVEPRLRQAVEQQGLDPSLLTNWSRLAGRLREIFPAAQPSLLHGDLWSGNFLFNRDQRPVLVDPAVYYGHPEMELAFTKMFGGFSSEFYDAYQSVHPLPSGFPDRVPIYNFYPLLVHANLFGGGYLRQSADFLKRF
ncbi:MAG: fructosamine kinase family protein [Balneolaceae bacterium]